MSYKFSYIEFKQKQVQNKGGSKYKVYKNTNEYVMIEALTAYEAIEKSGIESPLKLEKTGLMRRSLFSEAELN